MWIVELKYTVKDRCRSVSYKVDWVGWDWKSPSEVKYKAAYTANNKSILDRFPFPILPNEHICTAQINIGRNF